MSIDMEVFVVTGKPGERALQWVPFDEMKQRAMRRAISKYGMGAEEEVFVVDLLRAALGEDRTLDPRPESR